MPHRFPTSLRQVFDTESVRQGNCSTGKLFGNVVGDLNTQSNEQFDIIEEFPCRTHYVSNVEHFPPSFSTPTSQSSTLSLCASLCWAWSSRSSRLRCHTAVSPPLSYIHLTPPPLPLRDAWEGMNRAKWERLYLSNLWKKFSPGRVNIARNGGAVRHFASKRNPITMKLSNLAI